MGKQLIGKLWILCCNATILLTLVLLISPLYIDQESTQRELWIIVSIAVTIILLGSIATWIFTKTTSQERCWHRKSYERLQIHVENVTHVCVKCGHRINRGYHRGRTYS